MHSHEPIDYKCPFCLRSTDSDGEYTNPNDIIYKNDFVTAKVAHKWWVNNPGSVLVVPNKHYENIYDIPDDMLAEVYQAVKKVAIAMRSTYDCDGISTRQHNEPAGNQSVWHLHVHVFARHKDDMLYQNHNKTRHATPEDRQVYASRLKNFLKSES